jgi:hypothetical protein
LYVNGNSLGTTPLATQLPAGVHTLKCDAAGGKTKTSTVNVVEGQTTRFKFTFE